MLVKYIDSNYIIETLQKPSWGEVEEPDFYITMASNRVKALIFPSEQGDPNNLASYNEEQQEAIKLATAIYTLWYFDTNYDFTNGSVSVNFGGVSMSESKTYNGEMVLPNVFDILKQANLIPTTETFIFNNTSGSFDNVNINPEAFKDLQQEMERQADNNIRQDGEIVKIYDRLSRVPTNEEQEHLKLEVEEIQKEQEVQNINIQANTNKTTDLQNQITENIEDIAAINEEVSTNKTDIANLGNKVNANEAAIQTNTNKIQENKNNITLLDGRLLSVSGLLNQTIDGLRTLRPFKFVGLYDSSRTYMINEMVSKDDKFYLSLEDNNTTTPPGNKWLIMKEFQQVDLSDYPTKLEVNAIKTDLQNKITANTTNITDLQNNVVKISGNQTIAGTKTFNNQIVANEGLTTGATKSITSGYLELGFGNNVAYITPEDSSNKTLKFSGRSGRGRFDIDLESQSQLMGVKDPTRTYHAANKNYVDNLNNQNVKLAGQQTITGRKIFTGPGEGIQIRPNATGGGSYIAGYNYEGNTKKWVLGNTGQNNDMLLEASAGSINLKPGTNGDIYCYGKQIKNVADPRLHNDVATKRYVDETVANVGQGGTYVDTVSDQSISGNKVFQDNTTFYGTTNINNGTLATVGTNTKSLVNKEYVDTNINTIKTGYVNTNSDQTINGLKRFNNTTTFEAGTTIRGTSNIDTANIADGSLHTVNNDSYSLVNKDYVDRVDSRISTVDRNLTTFKQNIDTSLYTIYSTGNTIYNNLQKLTTNIFNNSSVDYKKPLTVSFTRTNNSGSDYGSYTFQIQYGTGQNNFVVGSNLYYDVSKTYGQLGDWVALTITPSYIQVQCWNQGDRIKNIKVQGWKKVI